MAKRKTVLAARSAKTGRFVKMAYAKRYPTRTVVHRILRAEARRTT